MALKINQPEVEQLLHELVDYTGETATQVLINALRDRLAHEKAKRQPMLSLQEKLLRIGTRSVSLCPCWIIGRLKKFWATTTLWDAYLMVIDSSAVIAIL